MNIWEVRSGKHIRSYRPEGPSGELYKVHTDLTVYEDFRPVTAASALDHTGHSTTYPHAPFS